MGLGLRLANCIGNSVACLGSWAYSSPLRTYLSFYSDTYIYIFITLRNCEFCCFDRGQGDRVIV